MKKPHPILTLIRKDLVLEVRHQYTFYGILLYLASTIFVLFLAIQAPEEKVWNGLFWMIQLFICVNAVAKSFLQESRGRMLYYYSIAGPVHFIMAKLIFNAALMILMSVLSLGLFQFLLPTPLAHPWTFTGIVCLGGCSLSLVFTFLAAIAAKARQNAAVMAILGFPLIIPQLLLLMRISGSAFADVLQGGLALMAALLMFLDLMVVALCYILFPFLWKE